MLPNVNLVNASPRKLSCKLEIGGTTITNVKRLRYSSDWSGRITVGQVISAYISVTIPTIANLAGANVTLSMGVGDPATWTQIGTFRIAEESIRTRQGFTSFNAYDKLYDTSNTYDHTQISWNSTVYLSTIYAEVCRQIGLTSYPALTYNPELSYDPFEGYTLRDALGFIAGAQGKNAYLSPGGALEMRWFSVPGTTYTANGTRANVPYIGETVCSVTRLICQTENGVITAGNGQGIFFTCPFMTQDRLNAMVNSLSFSYNKADVDIPYGNYCLQAGDIISVTTVQNVTLTVPIMANSWVYDGGLSSTVSSYGVSDYQGMANNAEHSVSAQRVNSILERKRAANRVTEAITEATNTITGATGGIMRINMGANGKPAELLILDTGDISTAQNVFRLNENGLGYSSNGYNGPYAAAITAAGLIVTDRFVGNTISGVTLETAQPGSGSRSQTVTENGSYELNRIATDDTVHFVGRLAYVPRGAADELDSVAIRAQQGNAVTIGYENAGTTNDEFIYYSDLSAAPEGLAKFNFWGDIRIFINNQWLSISDIQTTLNDHEQRIQTLEQALDNGQ